MYTKTTSTTHRLFWTLSFSVIVLSCLVIVLTACSRETSPVEISSTKTASSQHTLQQASSTGPASLSAFSKIDSSWLNLITPEGWSVAYDRQQPNGSRVISIDAVGDALLNIELFSKTQVESLSKSETLGLEAYTTQYNKTSQAFAVLSSKEFTPTVTEISRLGLIGIREFANIDMAGIDASYLKEFYSVDFKNGGRGFVVVEASPAEFRILENDFEKILQQLINHGR
ncbi:hypothetical protein [Aurantivibrio infirmus]